MSVITTNELALATVLTNIAKNGKPVITLGQLAKEINDLKDTIGEDAIVTAFDKSEKEGPQTLRVMVIENNLHYPIHATNIRGCNILKERTK